MSLSVLCATRAEACVRPFLAEMRPLAQACGGRFQVVLDRSESYERWTTLGLKGDCLVSSDGMYLAQDGVHQAMQEMVNECRSDYVLILDDDERCTPALVEWLKTGRYEDADFWYIARAWLYRDTKHYITSAKHWPNPALRIGRSQLVRVPTQIHAGWMDGSGQRSIAPYPLEHHKFLIRSLEERKATVERYEAIREGAGMPGHYLPECVMVDVAEWNG